MIPKPDVTWHPRTVKVADYPNVSAYKLRPEDYEQVQRYALDMATGAVFPPIRIADVRGKMHVVDGYHRLAASRHNAYETIEAVVAKMSASIARAWMIDANVTNGLPLTFADRKPIFAKYMEGKLHLTSDGSRKPYRTIAGELSSSMGTLLSHVTIRTWMEEYNRTKFKYDPDWPREPHKLFADDMVHDLDRMDEVNSSLAFLKRIYWGVQDLATRERIKGDIETMLHGIDTPIIDDDDDERIPSTLDI